MGIVEFFLCIFAGHVITVQSVIHELDARFPQDFAGLFDNIRPFPFKGHYDLSPYDSIFSSWRTPTPEFHMFAELPPIVNIPQVEVFCDESKLTLLVNKRSNGVILTGEEIQLGYGCFSNGELPNQFVFTYSLDECGTTRVMQNGLGVFTNTLHLNTKNLPNTWWSTPSTVHISCIPKRSYEYQNLIVSTAFPKDSKTINIKAMTPSWYGTADSNVYERGQVINVQVSARTRHEQQQLYIQSCFVSASPEPQIKPRHAVIINKGCTVPLGSPHAVVQFVTSNRADVVNFVLNTSYLISELYIHCSVLISDQGVTFGSKSCNYNVMKSRWEDLSGTADVCECCSSKCKGLSIRHLPDDAKAVVTTGPFVIVDKEVTSPEPSVSDPQETSSLTDSMQSDSAAATDMVVAGTTLSRHKFSHTPQGVVVVSKDPVARLTLWLPGHIQETEHGENVGLASEDKLLQDIPELQSTTTDQESLLNTKTNIGDQKFNLITLVDGWVKLPHLEEAAIKEESKGKRWFERSGMFNSEAPQEVVTSLPSEIPRNVLNKDDFNKSRDERQADAAVAPKEGTHAARPIIRTKLQFSKGADGSQVLSYEEEELKQQEGKDVNTRLGMEGNEGKQEHRPRGMFRGFLDLSRRMSKQE
ncbi:zona pellucida protein C [Tautogolabrus adspersus]